MKNMALLARPKGTPLIVCDCTEPRPWPLLVQHTWRFYEEESLLPCPTRTTGFVEVEWYVRNLRGHREPAQTLRAPGAAIMSEANDTRGLLYKRLSGSCPQCGGRFEVRFKTPAHHPNALLLEAAHSHDHFAYQSDEASVERGRQAAHEFVQFIGSRHTVRFERTARRVWKERVYCPDESGQDKAKERIAAGSYAPAADVLRHKKDGELLRGARLGHLWSEQTQAADVSVPGGYEGSLHKTLLQVRLAMEETAARTVVKVEHAALPAQEV